MHKANETSSLYDIQGACERSAMWRKGSN